MILHGSCPLLAVTTGYFVVDYKRGVCYWLWRCCDIVPGSLAYSTVVLLLLLPFSNSFAYAFRAFVRVCCEQSGENSILCGH